MLKRKNIKIILLVTTILIISVIYFLISSNPTLTKTPPAPESTSNVLESAPKLVEKNPELKESSSKLSSGNLATMEVNGEVYQEEILLNTSVYQLMDQLRNKGKINFKDTTYLGLGKFIEEINGIRGNGSNFWIYYVNGEKANIGVSNYKINPGDVVSWKYEKDIN